MAVLLRFKALALAALLSAAPTFATQDQATLRAARAEAVRMRDDLNQRIAEIDRQLGGEHKRSSAPAVNSFADLPATGAGYAAPAKATQSYAAPVGGPTCYVGPRGGTYTITKSGRKNYGGC
ncbi:MAG: hypothetical protein EOP38_16910 [Rubrivivax sp.]|nr:MAG: hypothetical protein EOP38_16910 [Rubrivivax sp.]